MRPVPTIPKYRRILEELRHRIASDAYGPGERLPSEAELVAEFGASRPTVGRAIRELQNAGWVTRRAGSGTYARKQATARGPVFGLLIPDLGRTEIFEPICEGLAQDSGSGHSLLWSRPISEGGREQEVQTLCRHYIEQNVSGVFFAPLEWTEGKDEANRHIARMLDEARIPLVLLDRCIETFPKRSRYDLIGIDNRRAGYAITEHLIEAGARRIAFIARPYSASTVDARIAGYREALLVHGLDRGADLVARIDGSDLAEVRKLCEKRRPDAFLCANDNTAALLMQRLFELGLRVPQDVRVAGFDDVKYASLLPVPLTTIHQPCYAIGVAAIAAAMDRIAHPDAPARDILIDFTLVVRKSTFDKLG